MNVKVLCLLIGVCFVESIEATVPSPVQKTGQVTGFRSGDDGELQVGVAWPSPRFVDHLNGIVRDELTGLEWVKQPHALVGNSELATWDVAVDFCNTLNYGGHQDWRLPTRKELMSLVDYGRYHPALPVEHPFLGVETYNYWSSTSFANDEIRAWFVNMFNGCVRSENKAYKDYVWPVRTGE